ncbi:hypothetical protein PLICRDRAFT_96854, partial [Plicaturopsis crispa FD-325 SS-3]
SGTFSFYGSYPDAPNPFLRVEGLGDVGLPLSTRDAQAIIVHSKHAPFGKGERTVVDTTIRDTWEIDASQVHIDNPAWNTWMESVVREVCGTLGVDCKSSKPRFEPYKLLLYETGSHFLPHQDTEKAAGMFATIVVVLPSYFTGGKAVLSHGELSATMDCGGPKNRTQTSVLSWYTDVKHEIKPITSGYRLAISYNLLHTNPAAIRPSLPDSHVAVGKLRHLFLSWKQIDEAPSKIVYLLAHQYAQATLKRTAMKGVDAHKLALLEALAKKHNFHVALASVECHVHGIGIDYGPSHHCGHHKADIPMGEILSRKMTITHLVDLEGNLIREKLPLYDIKRKEVESVELSWRRTRLSPRLCSARRRAALPWCRGRTLARDPVRT